MKDTNIKIRLYIDGLEIDSDSVGDIKVSAGTLALNSLKTANARYSLSLKIPITPRNRGIMGGIDQVTSVERFNSDVHTARIEVDGATITEGRAFIISCEVASGTLTGHYRIGVTGIAQQWLQTSAATSLSSITTGFSTALDSETIKNSWTWDKPVRFLPIERDKIGSLSSTGNIFRPIRLLSMEDYHPFLHIRHLLKDLFGKAGYSIESSFFESEFFESLYMSGNYKTASSKADMDAMDFMAGRYGPSSATADSRGRVHADPYRAFNSIGNIADTANPNEHPDGRYAENVYDRGGCFGMDGNRIVFTPLNDVTVAFRYSFFYTTDYYILDRTALCGFDSIYLGDGINRKFVLPNRFEDRKTAIIPNFTYTVIIFDHSAGDTYQLKYYEETDIGGTAPLWVLRTYGSFTTRSTQCVFNGTAQVRNPEIWVKKQGAATFVKYTGDWAMYDGYVGERGQTEVAVEVTGPAERLSPSNPKFFDLIMFEGAEPGMNLTVHKKTSVTPVFAEYPTTGSVVDFTDVAAHDVNGLDLIKAVSHLFNLRFYTDERSRTVYAEPRDSFYNSVIVDWSDKIDISKPVYVIEPGEELGQTTLLGYLSGDGAVSRWNRANAQTLGQWEVSIENTLASAVRNLRSPLFTASVNEAGNFSDAPNAIILHAGDRENETTRKRQNLNFPCKIVSFTGMTRLPEGQSWGWPGNGREYPKVVFLDPDSDIKSAQNPLTGSGLSLCFEDRDGTRGLHTYWDTEFRIQNNGKRIELYIYLEPHEIEQLLRPNGNGKDFRALYRLTINGDNALYRLEEIMDYDPCVGGSTRCTFIREI